MKFTITCLGFLLLLMGCSRDDTVNPVNDSSGDAALRQKIVGRWTVVEIATADYRRSTNNMFTNAFSADGSYTAIGMIIINNKTNRSEFNGKWDIKDGNLNLTITKTSDPKAGAQGSSASGHIIRANAEQLVYDSNGQVISLRRIK